MKRQVENTAIEVTFIDASTSEAFAVTRTNAGELPESFLIPTTLDIGDIKWRVVDAMPRREQSILPLVPFA